MNYDAYINYPHGLLDYAMEVVNILQKHGLSCYVPPDIELEGDTDVFSTKELTTRIDNSHYIINIDPGDHFSKRYFAVLLIASHSSNSIFIYPKINAGDIPLTAAEYAERVIKELRWHGWYSRFEKWKMPSEDIVIISCPYDSCLNMSARLFAELYRLGYSVYYNPRVLCKTYEDRIKLETCQEVIFVNGSPGNNENEKEQDNDSWSINYYNECKDVARRLRKHIINVDVAPYNSTEDGCISISSSYFYFGMTKLLDYHLRSKRINDKEVSVKEVFIAGSKSLSAERKIVMSAIKKVNAIPYFRNQKIVFTLSSFDDLEKELTVERKQDIYNQHIRNASLLIVIIDNDNMGEFTHEELNTAYSSFYNNGKPEICVFNRKARKISDNSIQNDLQKMMSSIQQYYVDYQKPSELESACILMLLSIFGHDGLFGNRITE